MGIHDLGLFIAAGLLLNITPGPDMALIIARSTQHGRSAGIAAALGIGVGAFIHIAAAAVGLSALILASAWAFQALKWLGAAYLMFLGVQLIRSSFTGAAPSAASPSSLAPATLRQIFLQGVLTNALNPKVAVFFLAFLPQFVDAEAPSKAAAFITLGLLFDAMGTAWNIAVAWLAGGLAATRGFALWKAWLERAVGVLFVGIGARLALAERS